MWIEKLKRDFHLAMVVVFCLITVLGITPFAFYRFANGQTMLGVVDLVIVACISFGSIHSLRTGRSEGAAFFVAMTYSIGCIAVAYLDGFAGLLWVFPVLIANFLLVPGWRAITIPRRELAVGICDSAIDTIGHKTTYVRHYGSGKPVIVFAWRWRFSVGSSNDACTSIDRATIAGACHRNWKSRFTSSRTGIPPALVSTRHSSNQRKLRHEQGSGDDAGFRLVRRQHTQNRFFRVGGEEFALLIPGADAVSLREVAEKLRHAVESEIRCHGRVVTISLGATRHCLGETAVVWQGRADAAMYRAKHNGRNCWVVDDTCTDAGNSPKHRASTPLRPMPPKRLHAA